MQGRDVLDETWLDANTDFEWAVNKSAEPLAFADIETYIQQLNSDCYAGHEDWRCPRIEELITLIDFSRAAPAMREEIPFRDDDGYWSITPSAKNDTMAWYVDFHFGFVHFNVKANDFLVRGIRDAR
jgi:hypothetical protein|tara:strand:+ start:269 stop:649 length:381 start_codon:yes stop_codon:yes gene_type:complete